MANPRTEGEPVEPARDADEVDQERTVRPDASASDDTRELVWDADEVVLEDEDEAYEDEDFGDSWLESLDRGWGLGV